ncbi:class I SAM-dependent methyltransferase [Bacillus sp. 3255]|uniref:class I SAM-dependent methyltransferase n=1 Tax=Bacillus sp. 3255 TaxID=2817904 RepID=UPI00285C8D3E|nr:class I SAM-dependent methyltransferase [Bacillus sp. 3255]MDR6878525.1 SAM-dependent methyltransferase [Bacillus sp. 3255]
MNEQSALNKRAWEYRAYEFWTKHHGSPEEKAAEIVRNPLACLKKHQTYLAHAAGRKIANLCGSNGRKAVPLALLGADVTVFDISEENRRYALELAAHAGASIDYVVTDIYEIDREKYGGYFDILYLEGGILHYFHKIGTFMSILYALLRTGGQLVLSDFHPLRRCLGAAGPEEVKYFDTELRRGDLAYKGFFEEEEQEQFPPVMLRSFTLSEIINAVIEAGFALERFDEHRGWNKENIPWEFTIVAGKKAGAAE